MSARKKYIRISDESVLDERIRYIRLLIRRGLAAGPVIVSLGRETRTAEQNAKLWPMLTDVSKQVEWYGQMLSPEDWKHVFTSALLKQRAVPGIDGGIVVLGQSTSRMSKRMFSDLIELIYAFGAEHGVVWSEPKTLNHNQKNTLHPEAQQ